MSPPNLSPIELTIGSRNVPLTDRPAGILR